MTANDQIDDNLMTIGLELAEAEVDFFGARAAELGYLALGLLLRRAPGKTTGVR